MQRPALSYLVEDGGQSSACLQTLEKIARRSRAAVPIA